jgi:hypothetical protein
LSMSVSSAALPPPTRIGTRFDSSPAILRRKSRRPSVATANPRLSIRMP